MIVNYKYVTFLVLVLSIVNYEFFPVVSLSFILFTFLYKKDYSLDKRVLSLFIALFYSVKYLSGISLQLNSLWYNFNQKNYITDARFVDLQQFLLPYRCRYTKSPIDSYNLFGSDIILNCESYSASYGPLTEIFALNINIWLTTVILSAITYFLIIIYHYFLIQNYDDLKATFITFLFISPPINFLTQRMNIDIILFVFIILFIKFYKKYSIISKTFLIILGLVKYHPVFIFIGIALYEFFLGDRRKRFRNLAINIFLSLCFISFIVYFRNELNLNLPVIPFRPDRTFGVLSEAYNFQNAFSFNLNYVYFSLLILIIYIIFKFHKKREKYIFEISIENSFIIFWFIITSFFGNYDYRLGLLILLASFVISSNNNFLFYSFTLFIFSSPGLLYSYGEKFNLVQDFYFVYLDFSFYFFLSLLIYNYLLFLKQKN